jgi:hypothetical protein
VAVQVPIHYDNLFDFLEDYRAHISELRYTIPTPEPLAAGQEVSVCFTVPLLGEEVSVAGRVMQPQGDRAGVQFEDEGDEGLARLEGFYRFIGQVVEQMLRSGRFKVVGEWAEGARPAAAVGTTTAAAGDVTAPLSERVATGEATQQGTVSEAGLTAGLMDLYRNRATGVFEVRSDHGRRLGWLKNGGFVQWENDPVIEEECLGVLLARAGKLSEKQLRQSLKMMNETGQKQGECLIEMGVLTFPKLVMSLLTQVEIITRNVFAMDEGTWSFSPAERLPGDLITPPMKTPGFLYGFYKRRLGALSPADQEALLAPQLDRYTSFSDGVNWDDLRMKKDELGLVGILRRKSYRLRSVFSVSNMGRAKTVPVLLALIELDILQFSDAEDSAQVEERWRSELAAKSLAQLNQNPFEVLEIHWTSQSSQVEKGYTKIKAEYENYARGAELAPAIDEDRQKILRNIEAAYGALKDKPTRQKTRKNHYEPQQHEFSADLLARQAEMLMVRGKWDEVMDNLERALEMMPNSGKTRALLDKARKKRAGLGSAVPVGDL